MGHGQGKSLPACSLQALRSIFKTWVKVQIKRFCVIDSQVICSDYRKDSFSFGLCSALILCFSFGPGKWESQQVLVLGLSLNRDTRICCFNQHAVLMQSRGRKKALKWKCWFLRSGAKVQWVGHLPEHCLPGVQALSTGRSEPWEMLGAAPKQQWQNTTLFSVLHCSGRRFTPHH